MCAHVCVLNCCSLPSLSSDIDECDSAQTCGPESVCVNTDGAYRCDCKPGYRTSGLGRQCRGESLFVLVVGERGQSGPITHSETPSCVCVCVYPCLCVYPCVCVYVSLSVWVCV